MEMKTCKQEMKRSNKDPFSHFTFRCKWNRFGFCDKQQYRWMENCMARTEEKWQWQWRAGLGGGCAHFCSFKCIWRTFSMKHSMLTLWRCLGKHQLLAMICFFMLVTLWVCQFLCCSYWLFFCAAPSFKLYGDHGAFEGNLPAINAKNNKKK